MENFEFKPVKLQFKKSTLCHILLGRNGWIHTHSQVHSRGTYNVTVIVIRNELGNRNSNAGQGGLQIALILLGRK